MQPANKIVYGGKNHIRYRRGINYFWLIFTGLCAVILMIPLFGILGYLLYKGFSSINLDFFIRLPKPVGETGGGVGNAIVGSLMVISMGAIAAIPIGIMTTVYIHEFSRGGKIATIIRFVCDLLNATPSIILGIFAYSVIVIPMGRYSAIAASFALFIMMIPVIVRGTEEILKTIPDSIRAASLALGASRWQTIYKVILPAARGGITTAVCLALARIGGETAPLLFTAFGTQFWNFYIDQPTSTLPVQIYKFASSPYEDWHRQAWAAALLLVLLITATNAIARISAGKRSHKS